MGHKNDLGTEKKVKRAMELIYVLIFLCHEISARIKFVIFRQIKNDFFLS